MLDGVGFLLSNAKKPSHEFALADPGFDAPPIHSGIKRG